MKDQLLLAVSGIAVSALAWAFWHVSGAAAWSVLSLVAVAVLAADNWRLRRALREQARGAE